MLIFGASGHAKAVIEALESNNIEIEGVFDDDIAKKNILGHDVFGRYSSNYKEASQIVIAIGDNNIRKRKVSEIKHSFGNAIHNNTIISQSSWMGVGNVVMAGSIIQASSRIGNHCIINTGAKVDHDCELEDFVHIAPGAILCGGIRVGENTLIGAGSIIIPSIHIGKNVVVGAGSVIISNVPDNAILVGCPAKIIKFRNNE